MQETYEDHIFPDEKDYEGDLGKAPPITQQFNPSEVGIIKELSPLKILETIGKNLRGFFWDSEEKEWKQLQNFKPLMNELGINKYIQILSGYLNDVITMSNFDRERADKLLNITLKNAIFTMYIYHEDWGIDEDNLLILENQIINTASGAFGKAVGAGDRSVIRGTLSENIMQRTSNIPMPEQGKKGWMSKLNPFIR